MFRAIFLQKICVGGQLLAPSHPAQALQGLFGPGMGQGEHNIIKVRLRSLLYSILPRVRRRISRIFLKNIPYMDGMPGQLVILAQKKTLFYAFAAPFALKTAMF